MTMDDPNGLQNVLDAKDERVKTARVHALVSEAFASLGKTRERQTISRRFMAGRIDPSYPKDVSEAIARSGQTAIPYRSPMQQLGPLRFVSDLAARWPEPKRHTVGRGGRESSAVSTKIERGSKGIMVEVYPHDTVCGLIALDAEAATTVTPTTAHWQLPADPYDYVPPEQWAKLPDEVKELWQQDGERYRRYARRYRRDGEGRAEWDDEYAEDGNGKRKPFRESTEASAAAVADAVEERVRSKIPLMVNALGFSEMAPINPRREGVRWVVDGLAERRSYKPSVLYQRGYRWFKDGPGLTPADSMRGDGDVTLERLFLTDHDGRPYLVYTVDGMPTTIRSERGEWCETIDLYDEYGFDFLPVAWRPGLHFPGSPTDEMLVPFVEPLMGAFLIRNKLITLTDYHAGQTAWGGWFIKPDPAVVQAYPSLANSLSFEAKALTATVVPGDVMPAVHAGAGREVEVLKAAVDMDLIEARSDAPEGADSGIAKAIENRDEKRANAMIWGNVDGLYADTATNANRAMACLARKRGHAITLNLLTDVPGEKASTKRSTVEFDADMYGGDYSVVAIRPEKLGDNPAKTALAMEMWNNDVGTIDAVAESIGESDVYGWIGKVFAQRFLLTKPQGITMILEDEAKINADLKALEQAKLLQQGAVGPDGLPMGAAAGVGDPATMLQSPQPTGQPIVSMDVTSGGMQSNAGAYGASLATGPIQNVNAVGGDASGLEMGGV